MDSRAFVRRLATLSAVPAAACMAAALFTLPVAADETTAPTTKPTKIVTVAPTEPADPEPKPTGKASINVIKTDPPAPAKQPTRVVTQESVEDSSQSSGRGTTSSLVIKTTDPFNVSGKDKAKEPDFGGVRQSEALGAAPAPKPLPTYNVQWVDPARATAGLTDSAFVGAAALRNLTLEGTRGADKWLGVWGSAGVALMAALGIVALVAAPKV